MVTSFCLVLGAPKVDPTVFVKHVGLVKRALELSGLSLEKAAIWMEMDRSQLHRQLEGDGHLSLTRLMLLPVTFWRWYGLLIAEQLGLPVEVRRAARMTLARIHGKHETSQKVSA